MKKHVCLIFLYSVIQLLCVHSVVAQPKSYIEHYGSENGLPQNTIMDMLQDSRGIMWFSTWDGLCQFDGYKFTGYRNQQNSLYPMRSNRIDHIMEDLDGYIWTLSYDKEAHRFDPSTNTFMGIRSIEGYEDFYFFSRKMQLMPSGRVWLISKDKGAISVERKTFEIKIYNKENGKIGNDKINFIYEDKEQNTWILTENGVYIFTPTGDLLMSYKTQKIADSNAFYTAGLVNGEVWLGSKRGEINIFNPLNKKFRSFGLNDENDICEIRPIDEYNVLITTKGKSFYVYNTKKDLLERFNIAEGLSEQSLTILQSYTDRSKRVWFDLDRLGVSMFNFENKSISHFTSRIESPIATVTAPLFIVLEDANNNTWVHPKGGGFSIYDPKENKLLPFHNAPNSSDRMFSGMLHSAYIDKQNNMWLCTHSEGLEKVVFSNEMFRPHHVDKKAQNYMGNSTRAIFEDKNKNLWISTKDGKIHVYDRNRNYLGNLSGDGKIGKNTPIQGIVYCMMQDVDDNIWLGTKGKGVYKLSDNGDGSYAVKHFEHNRDDEYSLSSNNIYTIFQDAKKQIWIGSYGGGLNLMQKDGRFINSNNEMTSYPLNYGSQIRIIEEDKYGNICVGTTLGLIMFKNDLKGYDSIDFKFYIKQAGNEPSLMANDVFDIVTTKDGNTYFATFGGGVNKVLEVDSEGFPTRFGAITKKQGLFSDIILQIAEDHEGKLWLSSEGNISVYNPQNKEVKTYSEISKIIKGYFFTEGSKYVSKTGQIYFGYSNGFLTINPHLVVDNKYTPYIALTNLQIANKDVELGEDSPLKVTIDGTKKLKLDHDQNSFNIEFAATDYTDPRQIQYAYMLEGFDADWIVSTNQRIATYNNLAPGKYSFRVKSTNSDGVWVNNERVLPIEIVPSFWQTNWAKFLYVVVVAVVLLIIMRSLVVYYRLRDKMTLEQDEIEMKTRFFMDISHEIRTPLTMIVSPIENVLDGDYTKNEVNKQLELVLKNAHRMLRMVNQILDFRKIEEKKLNIQSTLIGDFVEDVTNNFTKTAELHNVKLNVTNLAPNSVLWIDQDSIEKLLYNLLSNAFKYTDSNKEIDVRIYPKGKTIALEVRDQGKGMTKDIQSKLFTRFASFSTDKSKPSTGIGLSIVKEIVEKHKAQIEVTSEEGKGSTFVIYFQKGYDHFDEHMIELVSDSEDVKNKKYQELVEVHKIEETHEAEGQGKEEAGKLSILVVEDDSDLRGYILKVLEKDYSVLEARDGQEGYEVAVNKLPDFIISDIMMPNVDGVEFLQKVKSDKNTSHIPVILLTAKVDMESRLQGLKYGADDYLTKPFSVKYLKARIANIIEQRKMLYSTYMQQPIAYQPQVEEKKKEPEVITDEDKKFVKRVREIVIKNVDNNDFVVEDIAREMLVSRTIFFKKMKALTGVAPIEFIREVKIRYAAELIASTSYTIKEIAFMIGISDTKYFTKWFKTIMGTTPSQYREENRPN